MKNELDWLAVRKSLSGVCRSPQHFQRALASLAKLREKVEGFGCTTEQIVAALTAKDTEEHSCDGKGEYGKCSECGAWPDFPG